MDQYLDHLTARQRSANAREAQEVERAMRGYLTMCSNEDIDHVWIGWLWWRRCVICRKPRWFRG